MSTGEYKTPGTMGASRPNETMDQPGVMDKAKEAGATAVDKAKDAVAPAVDKAKEVSAPAIDQTKDVVGNVVDQAKQTATTQLSDKKDQAAESIGQVAQTLRDTGHQLHQGEGQPFAGLAVTAADRVEDLSNYLRDRDINDMLADVESFAREQPLLFVSGAFALGVLAARFLKSSSRYQVRSYDSYADAYDSPYRRSYQGYIQDYSRNRGQ